MSIETSKHLSPRCMLSPFEELDTDALRDTYDAPSRLSADILYTDRYYAGR